MHRFWQSTLIGVGIFFATNLFATTPAHHELVIQPTGEIQLTAVSATLSQVTKTIQAAYDIQFTFNPSLMQSQVDLNITSENWPDLLRQLLSGYNWIEQQDNQGTLEIFILARSSDTVVRKTEPLSAADKISKDNESIDLLALDAEDSLFAVGHSLIDPNITIPDSLLPYPAHALQPFELDIARLQNLTSGEVVTLNLPSGKQHVTFIGTDTTDNGETSHWIGYIGDEEADYDVIVTSDQHGLYAFINTPDGLQQIDTINGQQWWIDVSNSGLDQPDNINDTLQLPTTPSVETATNPITTTPLIAGQGKRSRNKADSAVKKWKKRKKVWKKRYTTWKKRYKKTRVFNAKRKMQRYLRLVRKANKQIRRFTQAVKRSSKGNIRNTRIDLLVAYTNGISRTRAIHLVRLANNAYKNSGVGINLRIVKLVKVKYVIKNGNNIALTDLTYSKNKLGSLKSLRNRHKADLVTLIRPFRYPAQDSCGIAWLGGANGSNFHPVSGFSVVSDGANNGYYCSNYTLAHEIGHNLGSAHDRRHAGAAGAYSYSYGFGKNGKAGSIMSYINPEVGRFSSPSLGCGPIKCGASNANNARSMNRSSTTVSEYR